MQTTQTTGARLYAVLGLLFVSSAMVLFLPFFPPGLQWLFALLFWAPLVAAYVLLRQLDRRRRSQPEPRRRQKPPKPGALSLARNPEGLTVDALLLAAAITLVVRMCMHISTAYFDYVLLAAVVFGAQARCVLAGRNWNTWRHQKTIRIKRGETKNETWKSIVQNSGSFADLCTCGRFRSRGGDHFRSGAGDGSGCRAGGNCDGRPALRRGWRPGRSERPG